LPASTFAIPGGEKSGSALPDRAHGDCPKLRELSRNTRGESGGSVQRGAQLAAGAQSRGGDRGAPGPKNGAAGPLVQRLSGEVEIQRETARPDNQEKISLGPGFRGGPASDFAEARLLEGAGPVPRLAHRGGSFAGRRSRDALVAPWRFSAPAHP